MRQAMSLDQKMNRVLSQTPALHLKESRENSLKYHGGARILGVLSFSFASSLQDRLISRTHSFVVRAALRMTGGIVLRVSGSNRGLQ